MVRNTSWTQMEVRDPLGDALTKFDAAFKSGKEAKQEKDAPEAFGKYLDSLALQEQAATVGAPTPGAGAATTGLVGGSHAAAEAAQDPLLTAFFQNARQSESGGDDAAKNPNSTATGRYQFLEGTWGDLAKRHPELGLTPDGRTDPAQQERAMRVFTQENARQLGSAGIKPDPGSLYAAHFLGAGGASKVLGGDPNSPVSAYVDPSVIQANPQIANMTVGQFTQWANEKGGNGAGGYAPPASEQPQQVAQQQPQGNGLPPRDVMIELFRNPNTRPLAIDALKTAQASSAAGKPTDDISEYLFAVKQGHQGSFADWQKAKTGPQTVINNSTGATSKFYDQLDQKLADQTAATIEAGIGARGNQVRLGELENLLKTAPQGAQGGLTQVAGMLGIAVDGLDDVQAAQAIINQMVPQQRPPGSGTMSDADLALFKQSLPAIINQPQGNQMILETIKGINQYTIAQADIAQRVANREITPAEGRAMQAQVPNPLAGLKKGSSSGAKKVIGGKTYFQDENGDWYEE